MREVKISLEINGRSWQQVDSLAQSGPTDPHYTVEVTEEGRAVLHFGDGAHGARPPSGESSLAVRYQPGCQFLDVMLQQGDVELEGDWDEDARPRYYSLYRGVVTNNLDPEQLMRIRVQVPDVLGLEEAWALPCLPVGAASCPATGKHVWVMFEHGDPQYPVWIGTMKMDHV